MKFGSRSNLDSGRSQASADGVGGEMDKPLSLRSGEMSVRKAQTLSAEAVQKTELLLFAKKSH